MADSQEAIQNYLDNQSDENRSILLYEDEERKDINTSQLENSLSLGKTIKSEICIRPENYSNIHFFCKNCHSIPTIEIIDILNNIYTCGCYKNSQVNIIKFFDDTLLSILDKKEEKNNIILDVFYFKKHKRQKYFYYCKKCDTSICRKCLRKEKEHKDHYFLIFDQLKNDANKKIEFIKKKFCLSSLPFDRESSSFLDDNLNKVKEYYIKFINVLINDYNNYACAILIF